MKACYNSLVHGEWFKVNGSRCKVVGCRPVYFPVHAAGEQRVRWYRELVHLGVCGQSGADSAAGDAAGVLEGAMTVCWTIISSICSSRCCGKCSRRKSRQCPTLTHPAAWRWSITGASRSTRRNGSGSPNVSASTS